VNHPAQVIVASEPLSSQNWLAFPPQSTLFVKAGSLQPLTSVLAPAA
jgi:glutamine amidotransferase